MAKRMTHNERRNQLIEVGRSVFARDGYEGTTVEAIARAAKVSKPIVYEHFGGKEGLFAVVVDREVNALTDQMSAAVSEGTARERLEQAVLAFLTYVERSPDGFSVLTRDAPMERQGQGMPSVISDVVVRVQDIFGERLKAAGFDPVAAPIYTHALIGMVTMVAQWWGTEKRKKFKKEEVAQHLVALAWMGLRHLPEKPAKLSSQR